MKAHRFHVFVRGVEIRIGTNHRAFSPRWTSAAGARARAMVANIMRMRGSVARETPIILLNLFESQMDSLNYGPATEGPNIYDNANIFHGHGGEAVRHSQSNFVFV